MSLEDLIQQLNRLDEDLKLLHIWNQSCQTQIEKVIQEAKQGSIPSLGNSVQKDYKMNPAVQKSFQGAFSSKQPTHNKLSFWKTCVKKFFFLYRSFFQ